MPANVSLLTMRTEVRRNANTENETQFLQDAEINAKLNYHLRDLWNELAKSGMAQYLRKSVSFSTTANQASYALATVIPAGDFRDLYSVDVSDNNNTLTARKYQEWERNIYRNYPFWASGWPVRYRIEGTSIAFIPTPLSAFTITVNYIPTFTALVNDTDVFDGIDGWEAYAIYRATAYCIAKEDGDASFWIAEAESMMAKIKQSASTRDQADPEKSTDVYSIPGPWSAR